ncbi:uncharacterized protein JCM6883_005980 [Sporobolomyces salmoneus]|uniref:uncharacterized protein n=1 Tax=Sporobolomyces salmoneus TaxID=183962 RepID=UPI0031744625
MAATFSLFSPAELSFSSVPLSFSSSLAQSSEEPPPRPDGRVPLQYRDITLQTGVSLAQGALGSAKVVVEDSAGTAGAGSTEICAGVRGEIENVAPGQTGGRIVLGLECAPTALPSLKPELPLHLASLLTSLFASSSLPPSLLSQLVVIPATKAWTLYLDVLILSSAGGNLIDLSILAARSALANVRLPQTRSIGFDGDDEDNETNAQTEGGTHVTQDEGFSGLVKGGKAGKKAVDFELVDGGEQGERLHGWQDLPIAITFDLINQIPHLDSTALESAASPSSLTVSIIPSTGTICGLTQLGEGELEYQRIMPLVKEGVKFAEELAKAINLKLKDA